MDIIKEKQIKLLEAAVFNLWEVEKRFSDFARVSKVDGFLNMACKAHELKKQTEEKINLVRNSPDD